MAAAVRRSTSSASAYRAASGELLAVPPQPLRCDAEGEHLDERGVGEDHALVFVLE
jgi:hypothetical protein